MLSHPPETKFILLQRVLFTLTGAATETLGGEALVAKGGPRAKVFATLAPLDLEVGFGKDPYCDIASRAEPLVLAWDNVMGVFRIRVVLVVV